MDFSDFNKAANRKRVNTDAEKLREKMSRETSKIIKLRVAQDTTYWDLKEKLTGVEAEHERLQQNMLDAQMQNQELSAKYQDELRLRPETLNRVGCTRNMCDVLEENMGRLRASLQRAAADRTKLACSYRDATHRVQAVRQQHERALDAAAHAVRAGSERGAALAASEAQARAALLAAAERAGALQHDNDELRARSTAMQRENDELRAHSAALQCKNNELPADLQQKERNIIELRREVEQRAEKVERHERLRADLQREVEACGSALERSRVLLVETEARATACAEAEARRTADVVQNLEENRANLERKLEESAGAAAEALRNEIRKRDDEAKEMLAREEAERLRADKAFAALQEEREARAREKAAAGESAALAERMLAERAGTVAQLMHDVAAEAEARARSDAALHAAHETATNLQAALQSKNEELARQAKVALEIRTEKERLQEIIRGKKGTMDNIQKELSRNGASAASACAARRQPPEHDDDNAMSAHSPRALGELLHAPLPPSRPRAASEDDLLYHFLSDSSMDADMLDPSEVNARFEALSRGATPPATSLLALKRRQHPGPRPRPLASGPQGPPGAGGDASISLSQVKTELATRGRTFFRNKRIDVKPKKFK